MISHFIDTSVSFTPLYTLPERSEDVNVFGDAIDEEDRGGLICAHDTYSLQTKETVKNRAELAIVRYSVEL